MSENRNAFSNTKKYSKPDKDADQIDVPDNLSETIFNKSVYRNFPENTIIRKNDYIVRLKNEKITKDSILKEFDRTNTQLNVAKMILLPKIADDLEMIIFLCENVLLTKDDLSMIFLNLTVCFDDQINTKIMDFIFSLCPMICYSKSMIMVFDAMLKEYKNEGKNISLLFDWYFYADNIRSLFILSHFIDTHHKDKILLYLENHQNLLKSYDYHLVKSICAYGDLQQVDKYLDLIKTDFNVNDDKIQNRKIMYTKFIDHAVLNKDVFMHMFGVVDNYKCKDFNDVIKNLEKNNIDTAKILCDNFDVACGKIDHHSVVEFIKNKNDIKILEIIIGCSKFDLHSNDDVLFRHLLCDEKYEMIDFLLNRTNEKNSDEFNDPALIGYVKKTIRFIENKKLLELIKNKYKL
jgi:hypothetical protein